MPECNISELVGVILSEITGAKQGSKEIIFKAEDGRRWLMYHLVALVIGLALTLIAKKFRINRVLIWTLIATWAGANAHAANERMSCRKNIFKDAKTEFGL